MFDFASKVYTYIKGFVVVTTGVSAVPIFLGLVGSAPITYVVGGVIVASSLFGAFDVFGMSVELHKFEAENDRLEASNRSLQLTVDALHTQSDAFEKSNRKLDTHAKNLGHQIELYKSQNDLFRTNISDCEKLIHDQEVQLDLLKGSITELQETKVALTEEVGHLTSLNAEHAQQIEDFKSMITEQSKHIDSLKAVQVQSKQLISALMAVGDDFKGFTSTIMENLDRIENTGDAMATLLDKLGVAQFENIDANDDSTITKEELLAWASRKQK